MVYQSCSIDETIGRIIRNTRVQDTAFIIDMHEWIPEAMSLMNTNMQHFPDYEDVDIVFHKGKLPCGLVYIEAVEWCGMRLPYGNSVKNIKTPRTVARTTTNITTFVSVPYKNALPDGNFDYLTELIKVLPECPDQYYQIELGYISTSMETAKVRIHFRKTPTDQRGLPLIPDNQNYKEAIYWYNRAKMIEAGFEDKQFKWEHCWQQWEFYAARAVAEIDYPSPDQMEHRINTFVRFIPPQDYFESFFSVTRREPYYRTGSDLHE